MRTINVVKFGKYIMLNHVSNNNTCTNMNLHTWVVVAFKGVLWLLLSCRGLSFPVLVPVVAVGFSRGLLFKPCCGAALDSNRAHRALVPTGSLWGRKSKERLLDRPESLSDSLRAIFSLLSISLHLLSTGLSGTWKQRRNFTCFCWILLF